VVSNRKTHRCCVTVVFLNINALCDGTCTRLMMENYVCSCTYALFDMCDSCCDSLWNVSCSFSPDQDYQTVGLYKEHDFCAGVVREMEHKNWITRCLA
jgi:hypothetical protein